MFIIPAGTGMTVADGVADDLLLAVSSNTLIASAYGKVNVVILGADRTSSILTLADCTGMSFSAVANQSCFFYFGVIYQSVATTTGINLSIDGPASPTFVEWQRNTWQTVTVVDQGSGRVYNVAGTSVSVDIVDTDTFASLDGTIANGSNAGTLILRFASEVDTSQVTVKAGSFLLWQRIA